MAKYAVVVLALLVATVHAMPIRSELPLPRGVNEEDRDAWEDFGSFQDQYDVEYDDHDTALLRFANFKAHMQRAAELNEMHDGAATFGVTKFADLTEAEFADQYLMKTNPMDSNTTSGAQVIDISAELMTLTNIPPTLDWNAMGVVTPPRDQGACGCCWAFVSTAAVESRRMMSFGQAYSMRLSPQQLVDCDPLSQGCDGGNAENAFAYMAMNGLSYDSDYPYQGYQGTCRDDAANLHKVLINGTVLTPGTDPVNIFRFIAHNGPATAGIDATPLKYYQAGTVIGRVKFNCPSLNHMVLLTGYDQTNNFFRAKNSWGTNWGESGFFQIQSNTCMISRYVMGSAGVAAG
jgi:C1A family cysteine protease